MLKKLELFAEEKAEQAEKLRIFSGVKLLHIKNQVELLLSHIGDYGIFTEYTKHDISHINEMLKMVEWIIPQKTKNIMTPSEWMMLVLSIYFHDMGMLISKIEFDNRTQTEFVDYKKKVLDGQYGQDYINKIINLGDKADIFLYQEYVRKNHAKRIRQWISGEKDDNSMYSEQIIDEIQKLLSPIDSLFRQDLALICESHHLNNLDNYSIYDVNKFYASDDEAKVNLQYIAVILRTADLLHITMDRTPAIEYNAFCPTDPISVVEWQKQMAIRSIRPMDVFDENENIDKTAQSSVIAITAYFEEANQAEAFFALGDYLRYVKKELIRSNEVIQNSIKKKGTDDYLFPWSNIDESGIKTKNFSKKLLKFELDQSNILQMLVGHTLYNDSSVVIRELIQNGLDAIKLQNEIERRENQDLTNGKIIVKWDSVKRELSFEDNGTGMTVYEIENYLLKVGSSKYSSQNFQNEFPNFVSISRFGIGILTCFLVANDVEIITYSSENNEANRIFFRNVDGKYLLKSLKKNELPKHIIKHGTIIKLHLRDDASMSKLEYNIKKWIVFPYCNVYLKIDSSDFIKIGYKSPKEALEDYISHDSAISSDNIIVQEDTIEGVTMAYALRYKEYFQEYSLIEYTNSRDYYVNNNDTPTSDYPTPIGICFEGIRVDDNTPGYSRDIFLAILNSNDSKIVKTNVARSSIEDNTGKNELMRIIYSIYKMNIERQINDFLKKGKSQSWISSEVRFLISQIAGTLNDANSGQYLEKREIMEDIFGDVNAILFENDNLRNLVSAKLLQSKDVINITESNVINAAEYLLRETKSNISLGNLFNALTGVHEVESCNLLCDYNQYSILHKIALKGKVVTRIKNLSSQEKSDII
ncbi:MAG: ATP-binding protein [Ruminococcus sp.]|nr:ATP-binding protein [Ruminococcus sp.]